MASPAKNFRNFHKEIHRQSQRGVTTKPSDLALSRFPHDSSTSSNKYIDSLVVKCRVEKTEKQQPAWKDGIACKLQVFATEDATRQIQNVFRHLKIHTKPFRCPQCRMIHLEGIPA